MYFRAFIFSLLLLAGVGIAVTGSQAALTSTETACENCTYERVLIDGAWWIFVYNVDGALIENYPDPEQ